MKCKLQQPFKDFLLSLVRLLLSIIVLGLIVWTGVDYPMYLLSILVILLILVFILWIFLCIYDSIITKTRKLHPGCHKNKSDYDVFKVWISNNIIKCDKLK